MEAINLAKEASWNLYQAIRRTMKKKLRSHPKNAEEIYWYEEERQQKKNRRRHLRFWQGDWKLSKIDHRRYQESTTQYASIENSNAAQPQLPPNHQTDQRSGARGRECRRHHLLRRRGEVMDEEEDESDLSFWQKKIKKMNHFLDWWDPANARIECHDNEN